MVGILGDIWKKVRSLIPLERWRRDEMSRPHDRQPGSARGLISVSDSFDEPLPSDIQRSFE